MNGNPRHSREEILDALLEGRRKISSRLVVRTEADIRSPEEHRILFGLLATSAQKETDLERNPGIDDVRMDELIPLTLSKTAVIQLREAASVTTMQELLSASQNSIRDALANENEFIREFVLAMMPAVLTMSYEQYLRSLSNIHKIFTSARH